MQFGAEPRRPFCPLKRTLTNALAAAGDGGDDAQLVAVCDRGFRGSEEADVLLVLVDVHVAVERTGVSMPGLGLELLEGLGDAAAGDLDDVEPLLAKLRSGDGTFMLMSALFSSWYCCCCDYSSLLSLNFRPPHWSLRNWISSSSFFGSIASSCSLLALFAPRSWRRRASSRVTIGGSRRWLIHAADLSGLASPIAQRRSLSARPSPGRSAA